MFKRIIKRITKRYRRVGYFGLHRRYRGSKISCLPAEPRWHFSAFNEFGLWGLDAIGFGLRLEIIGPFKLVRVKDVHRGW